MMSGVSISNPVANLDGVEFTATRGKVAQKFLAHREGLQDVDYSVFETTEALLKAFQRHQGQIANIAGKALDAGRLGNQTVVLQSLL
jgi:hypothetical protein